MLKFSDDKMLEIKAAYVLLKYVSDLDIGNMCLVNRKFNEFFKNDDFWIYKFFRLYGPYLKKIDVNKYRGNRTWREYYREIKNHLSHPFPYYISALAFSKDRKDIMLALAGTKNIKNVKKVSYTTNNKNIVCFTRDGTIDGIKEGLYLETEEGRVNEKVGEKMGEKINGENKIEKLYIEDKLIKETITINGVKRYSNKYVQRDILKGSLIGDSLIRLIGNVNGSLVSQTTWNRKGIKILKEKYRGKSFKDVRAWYSNSKIKKVGSFYKSGKVWKRDGDWKIYDDEGNLTVMRYKKGNKYL